MKIKYFCLIALVLIVVPCNVHCGEVKLDSWALGGKFKTSFLELRYFQKEDQNNYGLSFFTDSFWKNFPCQIKAGNMNCGGLWSMLKSPEPAFSFSPFYSTKTSVQPVTATLSSYSSFPQNISYFMQAGYSNNRKTLSAVKANCWYDPDADLLTGSGLLQFRLSKKVSLGFSTAAGVVPYKDNDFNSWFNSSASFFHGGTMWCFGNQIALNSPYYKLWLFTGVYQNPSGGIKTVYRLENMLKAGDFNFTLAGFFNPYDYLYLPGDTFLNRKLVLRAGVKHNGMLKLKLPVIVKSGINSYVKFNLSQTEHPLKLAAGLQFTAPLTTINLRTLSNFTLSSAAQSPEVTFTSQKITASCSRHCGEVTAVINGDWTFSPVAPGRGTFPNNITFTQKYTAAVSGGQNMKYSANASWSHTVKDGEITEKSLTFGGGVQTKEGWLNLTGKVSFKLEM